MEAIMLVPSTKEKEMGMGNTFALLISRLIKGVGVKGSNKARVFLPLQMGQFIRAISKLDCVMVKAK